MRRQVVRTTALVLGVIFAAAPAARAGTITIADVVRAADASAQLRSAAEVRLRMGAQSGATQQSGSAQQSGTNSGSTQQPSGTQPQGTAPSTPSDPTLSQSGGHVETVDLGDVTGTVCDCGEIPPTSIPKAGIPWWPILGGIPLICLSGVCTGDETTPPEQPTPPSTPTPEPMTLLLFGSGLLAVGARARRRYGLKRLAEHSMNVTTEEV